MRNKVYYIKPDQYDFAGAVTAGFLKAVTIMGQKGFSNLKFVVTGLNQLAPPDAISQGLEKLFPGNGEKISLQLKKDRGFSIPDLPKENITTGINLILLNSSPSFTSSETVALLIWTDFDSLKKLESILFHTQIELVGVVYNETPALNDVLSALSAVNISETADNSVTPYQDNFPEETKTILNRLKSINITSNSSNEHTRTVMRGVIDELNRKGIIVSYVEFLGFLLHQVNYPLGESINLLDWKSAYFGR